MNKNASNHYAARVATYPCRRADTKFYESSQSFIVTKIYPWYMLWFFRILAVEWHPEHWRFVNQQIWLSHIQRNRMNNPDSLNQSGKSNISWVVTKESDKVDAATGNLRPCNRLKEKGPFTEHIHTRSSIFIRGCWLQCLEIAWQQYPNYLAKPGDVRR